MELDDIDKALIALAQGDLEVCARPFDVWAARVGIPVEDVVSRLRSLRHRGVIRDVKAILRHRRAGFVANAMVVWAVPKDRVDEVGPKIAADGAVSHCYERTGFGPYTVFSMIHGRTREDVQKRVKAMADAAGIDDFRIFWSLRELKKTSMKYFQEGVDDE